jgi:hypothetical protein
MGGGGGLTRKQCCDILTLSRNLSMLPSDTSEEDGENVAKLWD